MRHSSRVGYLRACARCLALWMTLCVIGVLGTDVAASADCALYVIFYEGATVEPGDTVRVEGKQWGTGCWEGAPTTQLEGSLGRPLTGIGIFAVQGDTEYQLATVDADSTYGFIVDVAIPEQAFSGEIRLIARSGRSTGESVANGELVVVNGAPSPSTAPPSTHVRPSTTEHASRTGSTTVGGAGSPEAATSVAPTAISQAQVSESEAGSRTNRSNGWESTIVIALLMVSALAVTWFVRRRLSSDSSAGEEEADR